MRPEPTTALGSVPSLERLLDPAELAVVSLQKIAERDGHGVFFEPGRVRCTCGFDVPTAGSLRAQQQPFIGHRVAAGAAVLVDAGLLPAGSVPLATALVDDRPMVTTAEFLVLVEGMLTPPATEGR